MQNVFRSGYLAYSNSLCPVCRDKSISTLIVDNSHGMNGKLTTFYCKCIAGHCWKSIKQEPTIAAEILTELIKEENK